MPHDGRPHASESLLDSVASLRLADRIVREIGESGDDEANEHLTVLAAVLTRIHAEIVSILDSLRESRSTIENATVEHIQKTHEKLREISSTTESATAAMLDSLDRSLRMLDELETADSPASTEARARLREELFYTISCLQFQDITAQQIDYAGAVLQDAEDRMGALARLIDRNLLNRDVDDDSLLEPPPGATFDPHASMHNGTDRQAVADEIFPRRSEG